MCYITLVSTTSERDLSDFNTALVQFSRELPEMPEEAFLQHKNKWYLGSRDGCSCGFRHLDHENRDLGFSQPVEWWPEEPEDIEATLQAVNAFKTILKEGSKLDCVDAWEKSIEQEPRLSGEMVIDLSGLPDVNFRFIEGHRFDFTSET